MLRLAYATSEPEFDAAIDRALAVGLLEYRRGERDFTFVHPLLRQAADDTLGPADRLRVHTRWGEVLADPANHRGDMRLLVAHAHHWAATDDDTRSLTAALAAARATTRMGASAVSADLLMRAWELWDRVEGASDLDQGRDDLLFDLGDALYETGRFSEYMQVLERELDLTSSTGGNSLRRLCLRLQIGDAEELTGLVPDQTLYAEATDAVAPLLSAPAHRWLLPALNALGWHLRWTEPEQSLGLHSRALEVSREVGRPSEIAFATGLVAEQLTARGRHDEALAVCASGLDACAGVLDYLVVETFRGEAVAKSGQFRAAAAQLEKTMARVPDPALAPTDWTFAALTAADCFVALGHWDTAEGLLERSAELVADQWAARVQVEAAAAGLACLRGDLDGAAQLADQAWETVGTDEEARWLLVRLAARTARARVAADRGDHVSAARLLEPMMRVPGLGSDDMFWDAVQLAARIEGDRAGALGRPATAPDVTLVSAAIEALPDGGPYLAARHLQACADLARAGHSDGVDTWIEVADAWHSVGHVPNLGWAYLRLADASVRAAAKAEAAEPLSQAWRIAAGLGAQPLREAVAGLAHRARIRIEQKGNDDSEDRSRRPAGRLARLTNRELEVLRLVASGMSNDEIAATLFISPRTASVHVSRILAKLDVTSRGKATAVALEENLDLGTA